MRALLATGQKSSISRELRCGKANVDVMWAVSDVCRERESRGMVVLCALFVCVCPPVTREGDPLKQESHKNIFQ